MLDKALFLFGGAFLASGLALAQGASEDQHAKKLEAKESKSAAQRHACEDKREMPACRHKESRKAKKRPLHDHGKSHKQQ